MYLEEDHSMVRMFADRDQREIVQAFMDAGTHNDAEAWEGVREAIEELHDGGVPPEVTREILSAAYQHFCEQGAMSKPVAWIRGEAYRRSIRGWGKARS